MDAETGTPATGCGMKRFDKLFSRLAAIALAVVCGIGIGLLWAHAQCP